MHKIEKPYNIAFKIQEVRTIKTSLPTSHPRGDARVTRRQHYRADARVLVQAEEISKEKV